MCGRARLSSDVSKIKLVFSIPPHRPTPNFPPSWNVAPTDSLPVVRHDAKTGERSLDLLRWGLVPFWAKDPNLGFANIKSKAEGIETKPAFREAFQRRRWPRAGRQLLRVGKNRDRQATLSDRAGRPGPDGLAGLWENWRSPAAEWIRSVAVITTTPNGLCAALHNRMPAVLKPEAWPVWLGEKAADPSELKCLLAPLPSEEMTCWPVSTRVGNVKNNEPSLIERCCCLAERVLILGHPRRRLALV